MAVRRNHRTNVNKRFYMCHTIQVRVRNGETIEYETDLTAAAVRGRGCHGHGLLLLLLQRVVVGRDCEAVERLPHRQRAVDLSGEVRLRRRRVAQLPHRRRPRHRLRKRTQLGPRRQGSRTGELLSLPGAAVAAVAAVVAGASWGCGSPARSLGQS